MPVALAADAALAQREPGADFRQVRNFFQLDAFAFPFQPGRLRQGGGIAAVDDGAGRNFPDDGFAVFAMLFGALSAYSIRGDQFGVVEKGAQIIRVRVHFQNDASAIAAISSVRTALGHEFGPAEADQPVSSLSCPGKYADVVNKHVLNMKHFPPKRKTSAGLYGFSMACAANFSSEPESCLAKGNSGKLRQPRVFFRRSVLVRSPLAVFTAVNEKNNAPYQRNQIKQQHNSAFVGVMQAPACDGQRRNHGK